MKLDRSGEDEDTALEEYTSFLLSVVIEWSWFVCVLQVVSDIVKQLVVTAICHFYLHEHYIWVR